MRTGGDSGGIVLRRENGSFCNHIFQWLSGQTSGQFVDVEEKSQIATELSHLREVSSQGSFASPCYILIVGKTLFFLSTEAPLSTNGGRYRCIGLQPLYHVALQGMDRKTAQMIEYNPYNL